MEIPSGFIKHGNEQFLINEGVLIGKSPKMVHFPARPVSLPEGTMAGTPTLI